MSWLHRHRPAPAPADPAPKKRGIPVPHGLHGLVLRPADRLGPDLHHQARQSYAYVSCDGGTRPSPIPGSYESGRGLEAHVHGRPPLRPAAVPGQRPVRDPRGSGTGGTWPRRRRADLDAKARRGLRRGRALPRSSPRPGNTGPYNTGDMAGAVQVFFFVLCIGAFITVTMKHRRAGRRDRPGHAPVPRSRGGAHRHPDGRSSPSAGPRTAWPRRRWGSTPCSCPS